MKLINFQILKYTESLNNIFLNDTKKYPIKFIFYLQKNQNLCNSLSVEIEQLRMKIIKEYGILDVEKSTYTIPEEKQDIVIKKITELLEIEQEVDIKTISLDSLAGMELTKEEMEAIFFMIEE